MSVPCISFVLFDLRGLIQMYITYSFALELDPHYTLIYTHPLSQWKRLEDETFAFYYPCKTKVVTLDYFTSFG